MRYIFFVLTLSLFSCATDESPFDNPIDMPSEDVPCSEQDCMILNSFGFSISPVDKAIDINYRQAFVVDGIGKVCLPDALDFYISQDNEGFIFVDRVDPFSLSISIDGLENGTEYFVKMINIHCELEPHTSETQSVIVGEIPLPEFNGIGSLSFEDFRLAPDGDRFIYRTRSNDWYLSSLSGLEKGSKIFSDAFHASWNPNSSSEIIFIRQTLVDILPNLQGRTSDALISYDIITNRETILHEIEHLHDFSSDHKPEQYWIRDCQYSLDGTAIYLVTNKENGSTSNFEKEVFTNIWKYNLSSGTLESISDFLPIEFEIQAIIEDTKQDGNFYITGGTNGEKVENTGGFFDPDRVDIHYYNSTDRSLSSVFISDNEENNISIDPRGENLTFRSDRAGREEIWTYNISSQRIKQVTNSENYSAGFKWHFVNWITDDKFMTVVNHEDDLKFANFDID